MAKGTIDPWKKIYRHMENNKRTDPSFDNPYGDPLFDNPYIPPKPTHTEKEIRMIEKTREALVGKVRTKLDEHVIDSITVGTGITDFTPSASKPFGDPLWDDHKQYDFGYDLAKPNISFEQELKLPTYEQMLVQLFENDTQLIEDISLLADKENVPVINIIIWILGDYLKPIEHK